MNQSTKLEAKRLRATTFAIAKLEELSQYWKNYHFLRVPKIISHFAGSSRFIKDLIFSLCLDIKA